ncbi:hypothetical protein [Phenylobacterium sp.]|uniref:hypothetical protein n=1 Tax=Phenylobacterium sp. TaxID=1871053 RepID=UPI00272FD860|nr:hypothetical protein [Phenylobacterium sp.]MDP1874819.1 hypothetical protein [Phenylobacterium sp.]
MKAVFDTKPNSGYDDEAVRRCHFPTQRNYVDAAQAAVGDWIIYREPQRNRGRRAEELAERLVRQLPSTRMFKSDPAASEYGLDALFYARTPTAWVAQWMEHALIRAALSQLGGSRNPDLKVDGGA